MAYIFAKDELSNYVEKDSLIDVVYEIVSLIKKRDFPSAHNSLIQNQISFYDLVERTQRLKINELAKFADYVISHNVR